ncbi:MAG: glycosyltransferase family 4 protein [Bacteroidetes bacterium]|nr:glycosyltransferase family 4 protein [Bacteroidota bacterium]
MKVSLFVHDLTGNPIVRAVPIARAIKSLGHEIEIIGFTINSDLIYEPYRDEFEFKTIRVFLDIRWIVFKSRALSKLATGDVIYAFKPLWSSYFPALLASTFGIRKKLLLDIEDNEFWELGDKSMIQQLRASKWYPKNKFYLYLLHPFTLFARKKSVVCSQLQKIYGGEIVLHGPDKNIFRESAYPPKVDLRRKYNIPESAKTLLFAGTPVSYNGLDIVISALENDKVQDWHLILAGNPDHKLFQEAKTKLGDRCHVLGFVPNNEMPCLLKMADVVPILQKKCPATKMQIPAKLLEAMSMQKIIVGTNESDIKRILDGDLKNGIVLKGKNINEELIDLLRHLDLDKSKDEFGKNARHFFEENASTRAICKFLVKTKF